MKRELYVGFLLFLLTFLYLSHLIPRAGAGTTTQQPASLKALKLGLTGSSDGDKEVHSG